MKYHKWTFASDEEILNLLTAAAVEHLELHSLHGSVKDYNFTFRGKKYCLSSSGVKSADEKEMTNET